uniref:Uncharacterized protein n=1 Tax=Cannabis sativa TaxID=3483 RepID=A0A803QRT0_CANSA
CQKKPFLEGEDVEEGKGGPTHPEPFGPRRCWTTVWVRMQMSGVNWDSMYGLIAPLLLRP